MKKLLLIVLFTFLSAGCASMTKNTLLDNDRIIYRSLLPEPPKQVFSPHSRALSPSPVVSLAAPLSAPPVTIVEPFNPHSKKADNFIPFYNESSKINKASLGSMPIIDPLAEYYLIGHSHGASLVGNAKLGSCGLNGLPII